VCWPGACRAGGLGLREQSVLLGGDKIPMLVSPDFGGPNGIPASVARSVGGYVADELGCDDSDRFQSEALAVNVTAIEFSRRQRNHVDARFHGPQSVASRVSGRRETGRALSEGVAMFAPRSRSSSSPTTRRLAGSLVGRSFGPRLSASRRLIPGAACARAAADRIEWPDQVKFGANAFDYAKSTGGAAVPTTSSHGALASVAAGQPNDQRTFP
jgi:hypothetical protein